MAKSRKALRDELRATIVEAVKAFLIERGEDADLCASNKVNYPCLDAEGNDEWAVITVQIPTGEHGADGDPYEGYSEREAYAEKVALKAEKAKEAAAKKAAKIAKDKAERELRAKAKAEHQKGGE